MYQQGINKLLGTMETLYSLTEENVKQENRITKECLFCEITDKAASHEILKRFTHCYVIKDKFPVSPGHILIIPHEHIEQWFIATRKFKKM